MEDAAKLGDLALKLERYRCLITLALSWVIFGMIFGSMLTLANSLMLLGFGFRIFWILFVVAGILSGYTYGRFLRYAPPESDIRSKRRIVGLILMFIPFVIAYSVIPRIFHVNSLYFSTAWYPSLGIGLLLCGLVAERTGGAMKHTGATISVTSLILIPISRMPPNFDTVIGAELLCLSMMMLIYFVTAVYIFFRAQRVVYS